MELFTMGIGRSTMPLSGLGSGFRSAPSAKTECDLRYSERINRSQRQHEEANLEGRMPYRAGQTTEAALGHF
jgi:hypothetical protein